MLYWAYSVFYLWKLIVAKCGVLPKWILISPVVGRGNSKYKRKKLHRWPDLFFPFEPWRAFARHWALPAFLRCWSPRSLWGHPGRPGAECWSSSIPQCLSAAAYPSCFFAAQARIWHLARSSDSPQWVPDWSITRSGHLLNLTLSAYYNQVSM